MLEKSPLPLPTTATTMDHRSSWPPPAQAPKSAQSLALLVQARSWDQLTSPTLTPSSLKKSQIESIVVEESHAVLDSPDLHEVVDTLASLTAIAFIAYVTSTWIVFMTQINVSDMISTSTSCLSHAFTATAGVANDTIFHIRRSNIAAFMHITMTTGWVAMISAATILGVDLSGKDTMHFLFYYWTAMTHFMILWSLYLSLTEYPMPNLRRTYTQDQRATSTRAHNEQSPADQDHLSYSYSGQGTITPNILIAAANTLESRLYVDTGCSISIVKDTQLLTNVRNVAPIHVQGVA
eukprot:2261166-Rhodomonas_salina.1